MEICSRNAHGDDDDGDGFGGDDHMKKVMMVMMIKVGQAYKRGSHIRPTASDKVTRSIFLTSISKLMRMSVILLTILTMVMMQS